MSQGQPVPLASALPVAEALRALLATACERIEIAGSIRRRKPMVRDIEIVAIPRFADVDGLFEVAERIDLLDERIRDKLATGTIAARQVEVHRKDGAVESQERMGERYKALVFAGLPVDLFMATPDTWGCIFALRTGPGDWNTKLVTDCQRYYRRVEGGRVVYMGRPVPTPEEADFLAALGQPWVEPWDRSVECVAIGRPA